MSDFEQRRAELESMVDELDDYLLDDRLYKTITVAGPQGERLIKMTLGGMLERLDELAATEQHPDVVARARDALDRARRTHDSRYFERLAQEAKSYADSWTWFLQNCWEGNERCRLDYPQEVNIRLRLARLLEEGAEQPALEATRDRVARLDDRLRDIWQPADDCHVAGGPFPRDTHWWLYGLPVPQEE